MVKIVAPLLLNEDSFEGLLNQIPTKVDGEEIIIDLESLEFIDPYGMIGILELERHFKDSGMNLKILAPKSSEVGSYMERLDFCKFSSLVSSGKYKRTSKKFQDISSDILLEITAIEKSIDIHSIVDKVISRAKGILEKYLHYDSEAIDNFVVTLSEVCQNIPEHSRSTGLVAIQKYFYEKRLNKNVVKIAVMDFGIGIKNSLGEKLASVYKEKWSDELAIRKALFEGVSRYKDTGRGHGLIGVKQLVENWQGKITIRSGTTKLGVIPPWDSEKQNQTFLPYLPGVQVSIVLPEITPHQS